MPDMQQVKRANSVDDHSLVYPFTYLKTVLADAIVTPRYAKFYLYLQSVKPKLLQASVGWSKG